MKFKIKKISLNKAKKAVKDSSKIEGYKGTKKRSIKIKNYPFSFKTLPMKYYSEKIITPLNLQ